MRVRRIDTDHRALRRRRFGHFGKTMNQAHDRVARLHTAQPKTDL